MSEKTKEDKHTNLGEAKEVASRFAGIKNSPLGGGWGPDGLAQYGTLRALIAIAEELHGIREQLAGLNPDTISTWQGQEIPIKGNGPSDFPFPDPITCEGASDGR